MNTIVSWLQRRPNSILIKLLSGFVVISVALLALVVLIVVTLENVGNHIGQITASSQEVALATSLGLENDTAQTVFYQLRNNLNRVSSINEMNPLIDDFDSSTSQLRIHITDTLQDVAKLNSTLITAQDQTDLRNALQGPLTVILNTTADIVKKARAGQQQEALNELIGLKNNLADSEGIVTTLRNFNLKLDTDLSQASRLNQEAIDDASQTRSSTEWILIVAALIIILLALSFGVLLTFVISNPLEKLRRRFLGLAEGDFITPLVVINRDQFGQLADTFNHSIGRLSRVLDLLQTQALKVSSASAQIAATSRQSANLSAEQAGSVSEVAVTVEELSNTAQQIADAASLVSEAAEQALASASSGQETLRETILGINAVKARVQDIAVKILALTERSQQVGHVIEQINSIAEEIHLLALNAAIESAAAGENGKRFAVVAARVKQLADKSRNATKEVQTVLGEIQAATNASVMATEQGMKEAERGVALVHKGGNANESIIQAVERTVQLASAISLATQQQRSASEQVVATMQQLTTIIQDGATSSRQGSSLAIELDDIANQLKQISSQFKVEPGQNNGTGPPSDTKFGELAISTGIGAGDGSAPGNWSPEPA